MRKTLLSICLAAALSLGLSAAAFAQTTSTSTGMELTSGVNLDGTNLYLTTDFAFTQTSTGLQVSILPGDLYRDWAPNVPLQNISLSFEIPQSVLDYFQ